jgi:hypothetical protein
MTDIRLSGFSLPYTIGTTGNRPAAPAEGTQYFNTTIGGLQVYINGLWVTHQKPTDIIAPSGVTATDQGSGRAFNNGQESIAFTPSELGGLATGYTVTSTPGSYTNTGSSSPILVTGLQSDTSYTYTVAASNSYSSAVSAASAGVTATTVPQEPTIGTATNGDNTQSSVAFTAGATGGLSQTFTVTSSPDGLTASGASSPITVTGLTNDTAYTFTVTATNDNGTSAASAASNSITPRDSFLVDYLVVAGGGQGGTGGNYNPGTSGGGGGGAGGLRSTVTATGGGGSLEIPLSLLKLTNYGVTVGGAGSNSVFSTVTSLAGGYGGASYGPTGNPGGAGGSGGGGSANTAGAGTAGQGFSGQISTASVGGGGGAGEAGGTEGARQGGDGVAVSITGSSVTYAGGGGGGGIGAPSNGGDGGGGAGWGWSYPNPYGGSAGSTNTGGGGGGYAATVTSGSLGGSGIVILRYPSARTITVGAGLTSSTATVGENKVTTFTAGTGTVSFS